MRIDIVERPVARATDVVVEVKACGMVPNLGNVLANWPSWCPHLPLPKLPATFGLDPAGVVAEVGEQVDRHRARRPGLCQPGPLLRRLPGLPLGRADALQPFHLQRLFRVPAELAAALRHVSAWRLLRVHGRAAIRDRQAARQHVVPRGGAARLSRHRLFRAEEGGAARRQVHADQRHLGNARARAPRCSPWRWA